MTNDNFTEAASEEACARFLIDADHPGPTSLAYIEVFESAAAWARTHLAEQDPTDAEVEAAARAVRDADDDGCIFCRDDETPCSACTKYARAALSAARAARRDKENR
jgi:hypothetical protein